MSIMQLIIIAILTEAIVENLKFIYKDNKLSISMLLSLGIAILVCLLASVDIFNIVGIDLKYTAIGSILTGIIVARGANFVSDLFKKLENGGE